MAAVQKTLVKGFSGTATTDPRITDLSCSDPVRPLCVDRPVYQGRGRDIGFSMPEESGTVERGSKGRVGLDVRIGPLFRKNTPVPSIMVRKVQWIYVIPDMFVHYLDMYVQVA